MTKFGYFGFTDGDDYWQTLGRKRDPLEKFGGLSEKHGVKRAPFTPCRRP